MNVLDVLLWVVLPYVAAASFIGGHIIRFHYDQYGWTSRSSQSYESRLLRWGSPLFHFGILAVFAGHVVGLLIPRQWLDFVGVSERLYHLGATWIGALAAAVTVVGMVILLSRRGAIRRVARVTTRMDVVMYVLLAGSIITGTIAVVQFQVFGAGYDYRGSVSPWTRSLLLFQPDVSFMTGVPFMFQLHVALSSVLFLVWPYTRLVHVLSVPFGYLFRPYVVYRSRDAQLGARRVRRGWEKSEPPARRERLNQDR